MLSGKTKLLGIIGHPVEHTLSPRMHNAAFDYDGVDYVYVAMDVRPDRLPAAVAGLAALGFVGFNVTMPHKETIIPFVDELDKAARLTGAVNTVIIGEEGGRLRGFNTDGSGFVKACKEAGISLSERKVLVVGAGGTAAAIAVASLGEGASRLYIVNRTLERAEELRAKLSGVARETEILVRPFEAVGEVATEAEILINTTYLGMKKEDPLPLPAKTLTAEKTVCDAVYLAGGETALIRHAQEVGARTVSGGRMLLYQGVQAQRVWTGKEPSVKAMRDALA